MLFLSWNISVKIPEQNRKRQEFAVVSFYNDCEILFIQKYALKLKNPEQVGIDYCHKTKDILNF